MNPFERLREIAQVFGLAGGDAPAHWFDSSNPVCRDAEQLLRAGRFAEAEEIFARVLEDPRHAALVRRQQPRILIALATAQLRQEKWAAARESASRAKSLLADARARSSPDYAEACRLLGQAARGEGRREEALRHLLEGIAATEIQKSPRPADLVERRLETAALLREMERFDEAERQAREAVRIAAERFSGQKEEGDARIGLAECLAAAGRFEEARQEGERAASVHRSACGESSGELAEDYEKLGGICQKQGDYQAAVSYLEKALGIRDRQVGGDTTQLGLLLVALADLYSLIGRLAPALELLQQAVGKLGPARDANFADALEKLGAVYVRTGRYEDAADCYRQACEIWAASPEVSADRLASDIRALEELQPWLPEPVLPPKPALPDPGTPALLERPPKTAAAGPVPLGAGGQSGTVADALTPALIARGLEGPGPASGPALPHAGSGPPIGAALIRPRGAAHQGIPTAMAPVEKAPGGHVAPAAESGVGPGRGQAENPAPRVSIREALAALSETAASRRAGQPFWGWEELEFDSLRM